MSQPFLTEQRVTAKVFFREKQGLIWPNLFFRDINIFFCKELAPFLYPHFTYVSHHCTERPQADLPPSRQQALTKTLVMPCSHICDFMLLFKLKTCHLYLWQDIQKSKTYLQASSPTQTQFMGRIREKPNHRQTHRYSHQCPASYTPGSVTVPCKGPSWIWCRLNLGRNNRKWCRSAGRDEGKRKAWEAQAQPTLSPAFASGVNAKPNAILVPCTF